MSDAGFSEVRLTDWDIEHRLAEQKKVTHSDLQHLYPLQGHGQASQSQELEVVGEDGGVFRIILRQNLLNPLDFSAILGYKLPDSGRLFRLRRYDSKAEHKNPIERQRFTDFHIHMATARYQARGMHEETYAEPSNRFSSLREALHCLLHDCGFTVPPDDQEDLFPGLL